MGLLTTLTSVTGNSTVTCVSNSTTTVSFSGLLPTTRANPMGVVTVWPSRGILPFMSW